MSLEWHPPLEASGRSPCSLRQMPSLLTMSFCNEGVSHYEAHCLNKCNHKRWAQQKTTDRNSKKTAACFREPFL